MPLCLELPQLLAMVVLLGLKGSEHGRDDVERIYEDYDTGFSLEGDGIVQKGSHSPPREDGGESKDESTTKRLKRSNSCSQNRLERQSCGILTPGCGMEPVAAIRQENQSRLDGYLLRKRRGGDYISKRRDGCMNDADAEFGVITRAMAKKSVNWFSMLPIEMWGEVLSHLEYHDIGKSLCVCRAFSDEETFIWRSACDKLWPDCTKLVSVVPDEFFKNPKTRWRKCYEMLSLRAAENKLVAGWEGVFAQFQKKISPHFRSVLVEWMIEVAQEWKLESTMIFQAVRYLDYYLKTVEIKDLAKFQLIGISCLRLSISVLRPQMKISQDQHKCLLEPARFAAVCDGAATENEVVATTEFLNGIVPSDMKEAPNAKMYLRCLWYTISKTGIGGCTSEDMHIYVLAAFLLELGQIEVNFSTFSHSSLAGAAISLSLEYYGKNPWPLELLAFSSYSRECLSEQRKLLAKSQAMCSSINIRNIWYGFYQNHLYHEKKDDWDRALSIMTRRGGDLVDIAWSHSPSVLLEWNHVKNEGVDPNRYEQVMSSILV